MSKLSRGRGKFFGSRRLQPIGATKVSGKQPALDPRKSVAAAWAYFEALDYLENNQVSQNQVSQRR